MSKRAKDVEIPRWFAYLIIFTYLFLVGMIGHYAEQDAKKQEELERQEYLRNSFSPMSTSPEVQEAYDAIREEDGKEKI